MGESQFFGPSDDMTRREGVSVTIIYVLYLAGFVSGVTPLIGLIMAYVYRGGAPHWLRSHYTYQIRTFWIGLVYAVIGAVTSFIFIGYLVLVFMIVWYIVRCVKGLKLIGESRAVLYPETWWF